MQAIERNFLSNDLITISFLIGIVLVFFMRVYKANYLLGYTIAFFKQGFIEKQSEDTVSVFSIFYVLLFLFKVIIISVTLLILLLPLKLENDLGIFSSVVLGVLLYFVFRQVIRYVLVTVLDFKQELNYFLYSKNGYLYSICLLLFPVLIVNQYLINNNRFLYLCVALLLIFRLFLVLINNKKLIFNNMFYFILYFCTLELAPLLILYKTIN